MGDILIISGAWLKNLLKSIVDNDYCPLCDCHPSYGHAGKCPLGDFVAET